MLNFYFTLYFQFSFLLLKQTVEKPIVKNINLIQEMLLKNGLMWVKKKKNLLPKLENKYVNVPL